MCSHLSQFLNGCVTLFAERSYGLRARLLFGEEMVELEFDRLPVFAAPAIERGFVEEHILRAVLRDDEAILSFPVEKLHDSDHARTSKGRTAIARGTGVMGNNSNSTSCPGPHSPQRSALSW